MEHKWNEGYVIVSIPCLTREEQWKWQRIGVHNFLIHCNVEIFEHGEKSEDNIA